jgi:DNA-directed RNA polymerase
LSVITVARALRGAEDEFADGAGLTVLSRDIAQAVRDEFDYRTWMAEQAKAKRDAREDGIADYVDLRRAFQARYPNADARAWRRFSGKLELARTDWDQETQVQLGAALVQALADAAPTHFVIDTRRLEGGRTQKFLRLSAETSAVMRDVEERASISRPQLMPMLIPPLPWRYEQ